MAKRISETEPPKNPLKRKAKTRKQSDADLCAIISRRQDQRKEKFDSMFTSIIAKCSGNQAEKSGSEPTEEEFEAARRRLESQKQNKKRKK